ncbi:hypothetical protein AKJ16_DCAP17337 [Drosera capensis]
MGLGMEFESLIAMVMNAPIAPSFDDIRSKLLLHEQQLKFLSSADLSQHQAFAAAPRYLEAVDAALFRVRLPNLPNRPRDSSKGSLGTVRCRSRTVPAFATGLTDGSNETV